jgi:hypothetical protein
MKQRILKHILFIAGSLICVFISVNLIFTHLHDRGQIGMIIGLFSFQLFFVLAAYRLKWWIAALLLVLLLLTIPLTLLCMKFIYYGFINPENGTPVAFELFGYALYFILALLLIEAGVFIDQKYSTKF